MRYENKQGVNYNSDKLFTSCTFCKLSLSREDNRWSFEGWMLDKKRFVIVSVILDILSTEQFKHPKRKQACRHRLNWRLVPK